MDAVVQDLAGRHILGRQGLGPAFAEQSGNNTMDDQETAGPPASATPPDARLVDAAVALISRSMQAQSTAQMFVDLQGWRAWKARVPGAQQDKLLGHGNDLLATAREMQEAATTLRILGSPRIVTAVDQLMAALLPAARLIEERSPDKAKWNAALDHFVTARNEAEATIRNELSPPPDRAVAVPIGATSLIARSRSIEGHAALLQVDGIDPEAVDRVVTEYHEWLADTLAWLPDDLRERFRGEYEGSSWTSKIKAFLSNPAAPNLMHANDASGLVPEWTYPFERTFKGPLNAQRQVILEADRRQPNQVPTETVDAIREIWSRLGHAAVSLRRRHGDRVPLLIDDEYDLQYLVGFLLRCHFQDVRAEEPTPSSGGASARTDFLLVNERLSIELKLAGENLRDKRLGEQIAADLVRYRKHPDAKVLVFLIYDPRRTLANPAGLAADFTRSDDDPAVYLFVTS